MRNRDQIAPTKLVFREGEGRHGIGEQRDQRRHHWLDGARAESLRVKDLSESLYLHYRLALGFTVTQAEDRVGIGIAPDWSSPEFAPKAGATVDY